MGCRKGLITTWGVIIGYGYGTFVLCGRKDKMTCIYGVFGTFSVFFIFPNSALFSSLFFWSSAFSACTWYVQSVPGPPALCCSLWPLHERAGRRLAGTWTAWRASASTSAIVRHIQWQFQEIPCQGQHARPTVAGCLPRCRPEAGRRCPRL